MWPPKLSRMAEVGDYPSDVRDWVFPSRTSSTGHVRSPGRPQSFWQRSPVSGGIPPDPARVQRLHRTSRRADCGSEGSSSWAPILFRFGRLGNRDSGWGERCHRRSHDRADMARHSGSPKHRPGPVARRLRTVGAQDIDQIRLQGLHPATRRAGQPCLVLRLRASPDPSRPGLPHVQCHGSVHPREPGDPGPAKALLDRCHRCPDRPVYPAWTNSMESGLV